MGIESYATVYREKNNKKRRRIIGAVIIAIIVIISAYIIGILTSDGAQYQMRVTAIEENHVLKEQIAVLNERVKELEAQLEAVQAEPTPSPEPEAPQTPRD